MAMEARISTIQGEADSPPRSEVADLMGGIVVLRARRAKLVVAQLTSDLDLRDDWIGDPQDR